MGGLGEGSARRSSLEDGVLPRLELFGACQGNGVKLLFTCVVRSSAGVTHADSGKRPSTIVRGDLPAHDYLDDPVPPGHRRTPVSATKT